MHGPQILVRTHRQPQNLPGTTLGCPGRVAVCHDL